MANCSTPSALSQAVIGVDSDQCVRLVPSPSAVSLTSRPFATTPYLSGAVTTNSLVAFDDTWSIVGSQLCAWSGQFQEKNARSSYLFLPMRKPSEGMP